MTGLWIVGSIVAWLACGYAGWRIQVGRLGSMLGLFDAIMIGPCMLMGPLALVLVRRNGG